MKKRFALFLMMAVLLMAPGAALAHYGWLAVPEHDARVGRDIKMFIGWGHKYPLDDFLETSAMGEVRLYDPKGGSTVIAPYNAFSYQTPELKEPGVYLAAGAKKPGFHTRLKNGWAPKPKPGLKDVVSCGFYHFFMKAVINVGQGPGDVSRVVGQDLELVPLKNPGRLRVGDDLPIKVLFKGKPVESRPDVLATYHGFRNARAFAHASHAGKDGVANLRILHHGVWLVLVKMKEPYPDAKKCDRINYTSVLTFEIK